MTTPTATARTVERSPTRWWVLAVVCAVQLVVVLDNTILNVAVPVLITELSASTADVQWMINSYALVQAGLLLTAGSAADSYGRRRMLLSGLVIFGLGSLGAGIADSVGQLIAARAGMGVGGALLVTSILAVAMQVFDVDERPRAIGVWAGVSALGFAAGPPVGGLILAHARWGTIFLINVPIVLVALVAAVALVPESRNPDGGRLDLAGAALSTAGVTAVVYAIVSGPDHGWGSGRVLGPAVAGLLLLAAFVRWERRLAYPMLNLDLFADRRFVAAVAGVLLITFGSAGALFLLTQQLQFVRGYPPLEAGLRMAPFALAVVALNITGVTAWLLHRMGRPTAIAVGMALLAAGLAVVGLFPTQGYGVLLTGLLSMGAGCALANPAIVAAVMDAIPTGQAGAGAGIDGTMTELGGSLGVAVLGAVLNVRFTAALPAAAVGVGSFPAALQAAATDADRRAVIDAFVAGLEISQVAGAVAVLVGGCLTAVLLHRADRRDPGMSAARSAAAPAGPPPR